MMLARFAATFVGMGRVDADAAMQRGDRDRLANAPVALLTGLRDRNRTTLGFAPGVVVGEIDGSAIPEDDWDMLATHDGVG